MLAYFSLSSNEVPPSIVFPFDLLLNKNTKIIGVVKADAYGGGQLEIVEKLISLGVDTLAVGYTAEGLNLRKLNIKVPITSGLLDITSAILGINIKKQGRNLKNLGINYNLNKLKKILSNHI